MLVGMLWIVGVYGLTAAAVYLVYLLRRRQSGKPAYLVVCVTCNHERQIEWYMRMFLMLSGLRGRAMELRVLDEGSSDDTLRIVEKFARGRDHVGVLKSREELEREIAGREAGSWKVYELMSGSAGGLAIPVFP